MSLMIFNSSPTVIFPRPGKKDDECREDEQEVQDLVQQASSM